MKLEQFDFYLPEELIAQTPLLKRDTSKLLCVDRKNNSHEHKVFSDIIDYFNPGDTLVLNNTRVMPARLYGAKKDTGAAIEVLLLKNLGHNDWECLVKPAKRIKEGSIVSFGDGIMILRSSCTLSISEVKGGVKEKFANLSICLRIINYRCWEIDKLTNCLIFCAGCTG